MLKVSITTLAIAEELSQDGAIAESFTQTCATRPACNVKAGELAGGEVVPVAVQGVCSYSVYAGHELEFVVHFRLKSLKLKPETVALAREIYGTLAPKVEFHGLLGDADEKVDKREPLLIYVMSRMRGVGHLDFFLANGYPENSEINRLAEKSHDRYRAVRCLLHIVSLNAMEERLIPHQKVHDSLLEDLVRSIL